MKLPLVFTHLYKCSGFSLRTMLHRKFDGLIPQERMHVPGVNRGRPDNLPMMKERGEVLPRDILLLADHTPYALYDEHVLTPGEIFRITILRTPLDRFESWYNFCVRWNLISERWTRFKDDLGAMPEAEFVEMCHKFDLNAGYVYWFDPATRDFETALHNLLSCDVIGRHDDLEAVCAMFNARNPYGVRFARDEVLHVNQTPRSTRLSPDQHRIARDILKQEFAIWESPAVQNAMQLPA